MYGIGSVSKMFAAVAAMKLVNQGKVELDAPITRYLPEFTMLSPAYRQITVRMLLDHSSGFPGSTYGDAITSVYFPGYLQQMMDALASGAERPARIHVRLLQRRVHPDRMLVSTVPAKPSRSSCRTRSRRSAWTTRRIRFSPSLTGICEGIQG